MVTPISPERAVKGIPTISSAAINPQGTAIVFVRTKADADGKKPESQIWLCDVDGGNQRQLTQAGKANAEPVWSPDGSAIAFVTTREGDQPNAIALLSLGGGESKLLTNHLLRPGDLQWSPDGSIIAYTVPVDPDNPEEKPRDPDADAPVRITSRADYKQDGLGYINDVRNQIFLLDVATEERRQLTSAKHGHLRSRWSPDGKTLYSVIPNRGGITSRFALIDVESGDTELFGAEEGAIGLGSWSPDGSTIFLSGDENTDFHSDYYLFDVATKSMNSIVRDVEFTAHGFVFFPGAPVWLSDTSVLVTGSSRGKSGLWTIGVTTGSLDEVGLWEASSVGTSTSNNRDIVVQTTNSNHGYAGIATITIATGERTVLWNELEEFLTESPVALWELVSVERNGFTIEGWLYKPADFDETKTYPIVLDIHGGPQGAYGYDFNIFAQVSATNGYLTLLSNPRGSTDYGRAFATAAIGDWGVEDWADLEAILDSVVARPYVDAALSGVYGYSYGGYMTSWAIGQTNRFKAAVCGAPVFNLISMYGSSDLGYHFLKHQIGGTPWTNFEDYIKHSPSTYVHNVTTPTLIVCGEADDRCPIGQAEEMFTSLLALGVESEFARYPGGAHPFIATGPYTHRIDFLERYLAWFGKYLGANT
ncbi:MAG: S9 family peptidase [Thermomicrobiales bacterium]